MFHWTDNVYFGRNADGSVRILGLTTSPPEWPRVDHKFPPDMVRFDYRIPPEQWASVIAAVSKPGETGDSYKVALRFHDGDYKVVPDVAPYPTSKSTTTINPQETKPS